MNVPRVGPLNTLEKWILGAVASFILLLAGTTIADNRRTTDSHEARLDGFDALAADRNTRLTILEINVATLNNRLDRMESQLDRIEQNQGSVPPRRIVQPQTPTRRFP